MLNELALQRVKVLAVGYAFDGAYFTSLRFRGKDEAGTDRAAVEEHGAGTAITGAAAFPLRR